jgi:uncharacterized protein
MTKISIIMAMISLSICTNSIAASFDCSKANGYVELTICTTPELSALDEQLSNLYLKVNKLRPENVTLIKKSQLIWLKDVRNKATSAQILKEAYLSRINDLNMMLVIIKL